MERKTRFRILVVDDLPQLHNVTIKTLGNGDYELFSAVSAKECMLVLKKEKPDIVLLDVKLADGDGKELCKKIKSDPEFSSVFIILSSPLKIGTSFPSEDIEVGADDYIFRPIESNMLLASVASACRTLAAERGMEAAALKWKSTFNGISDPIFLLDGEGIITQANKSALILLNATEADLLGHYCYEKMNCYDTYKDGCPFIKMLKSGKRETAAIAIGKKWYDVTADPIFNESGTLSGAVHFMTDITDRRKIEENLLKNKKLLQSILDNSQTLIYLLDLDGRFILGNRKLVELFKTSTEQLIGNTREFFMPHEMADQHRKNDLAVVKSKEPMIFEEENSESDGKHYYLTEKFPLLDSEGKVYAIGGISYDITQRKETEAALIENERLLRESQSIAHLGSFMWDIDKGYWTSSEILDEIFGIDENFVHSFEGWVNIVHPAWRAIISDYFIQRVFKKHEKFDKEYQIIRQVDGTERWVHGISELMFNDLNQPTKLVGTIIDITEHRIAEQALEERTRELQKELEERKTTEKELIESHKQLENSKMATLNLLEDITSEMKQPIEAEELMLRHSEEMHLSEEKFKNVFEYASVGKSMTALDGTVHANKAFCKLLGYSKKELKNLNWRMFTHPDDVQKNDEIFESILKGEKKSARWEKRYFNKNNEIIWVDISTTLLRASNGDPLYFITTIVDITEKKRSEEKINELNSELEKRVRERTLQLEEANSELQAFAYSVSHDLRAPLRAIDGFSKFVAEDYGDKLDSGGQRLLGLIRSNTQKMDKLITDILSLSRVTRSEHKKSKIDMTKMAISMISEAASPDVQEKIKFIIDPLPLTYADPAFIKQVWINLISNAIKFSSLKIKPEIKIGGYKEDGYYVYFISDNGVGFNPEYAHKLFGVFQRLHKADEFEGTGVGLAIVQRIIHRHGGKVWAESIEGRGATFYFSLPVS
jgi:PAS domain S-box-containing protein